jgi:hypothetical protein
MTSINPRQYHYYNQICEIAKQHGWIVLSETYTDCICIMNITIR